MKYQPPLWDRFGRAVYSCCWLPIWLFIWLPALWIEDHILNEKK